MNSALTTV